MEILGGGLSEKPELEAPPLSSRVEHTITCSRPWSKTFRGLAPLKKSRSKLLVRFTLSSVSKALPWKRTSGFEPAVASCLRAPKLLMDLKFSTPNSCMSRSFPSKRRPRMSRNGRFFELEPNAKRLWSSFLHMCSSLEMSSKGCSGCLREYSVERGTRRLFKSRSRVITSAEDLFPRMISAVLAFSTACGSRSLRICLPFLVFGFLAVAFSSAASDMVERRLPARGSPRTRGTPSPLGEWGGGTPGPKSGS
mmetsp:Transcript_81792/g.243970  ORF Transcript_81792/g.243970 Transcript_81792/m.243970 type:complete len:251 (-) Transcript_81792:16-768(-)